MFNEGKALASYYGMEKSIPLFIEIRNIFTDALTPELSEE